MAAIARVSTGDQAFETEALALGSREREQRVSQASNVVSLVLSRAREHPNRLAIVVPAMSGRDEVKATFGELGDGVGRYANGFVKLGFSPGDRVALLAPASVDLFAITLGALAAGLTAVFIDGRLDRARVLDALRTASVSAVVGMRRHLRWWPIVPVLHSARRFSVDGSAFGVSPIDDLGLVDTAGFGPVERTSEHSALISFTSGSTGRPKGADRTHGVLFAQHCALLAAFPRREDEVDMPFFPAVVLHNLCAGVTSVLPPADLRRPSAVDPARIADAVHRFGVTSLSASPAIADRLVRHDQGPRCWSGLRRVAVGGAPVFPALCDRIGAAFSNAATFVVYGSTEAEPIAVVSTHEVRRREGEGVLVGPLVPSIEGMLRGASAELLVRGAHVNRRYFNDPDATAATKVLDADGSVWHCTGDVGRFDDADRFWLLGRVDHAVIRRGETLHPLAIESIVADVPGVERSALIAHGRAPEGELLVVAREAQVDAQVRRVLQSRGLDELPVRRVASIPVDARHESKVDRAALRRACERGGRFHA